jgi:hypothetical protein
MGTVEGPFLGWRLPGVTYIKREYIFSLYNPAVSVHPRDSHMGPRLLGPSLFLTLFECCLLRPRAGPWRLSRLFDLPTGSPPMLLEHGDSTGAHLRRLSLHAAYTNTCAHGDRPLPKTHIYTCTRKGWGTGPGRTCARAEPNCGAC